MFSANNQLQEITERAKRLTLKNKHCFVKQGGGANIGVEVTLGILFPDPHNFGWFINMK